MTNTNKNHLQMEGFSGMNICYIIIVMAYNTHEAFCQKKVVVKHFL